MNRHNRKKVAPVIITVLIVLYYMVYALFLIEIFDGVLKYVLGVIPLLLSCAVVKVCIERLNEIKKGEEDDISKY